MTTYNQLKSLAERWNRHFGTPDAYYVTENYRVFRFKYNGETLISVDMDTVGVIWADPSFAYLESLYQDALRDKIVDLAFTPLEDRANPVEMKHYKSGREVTAVQFDGSDVMIEKFNMTKEPNGWFEFTDTDICHQLKITDYIIVETETSWSVAPKAQFEATYEEVD